jgi:hypothetical protein
MSPFCDDIDLLSYEPTIFSDAVWASQTLFSGTGDLAGTTLTLVGGGSLASAPVEPRHVAILSGAGVNGTYPILARLSNTQLTLSTLYDDLLAPSDVAVPGSIAVATGLNVKVCTFSPQIAIVGGVLMQSCGIVPGTSDEQDLTIVNTVAFRRPCALGVLTMVFGSIAAVAGAPATMQVRADFYERAYRRALRSINAHVDTNGDGIADVIRPLNVLELRRA